MVKRIGTVRRTLSLSKDTADALTEAVAAEKKRRGVRTEYGIESELTDAALQMYLGRRWAIREVFYKAIAALREREGDYLLETEGLIGEEQEERALEATVELCAEFESVFLGDVPPLKKEGD